MVQATTMNTLTMATIVTTMRLAVGQNMNSVMQGLRSGRTPTAGSIYSEQDEKGRLYQKAERAAIMG